MALDLKIMDPHEILHWLDRFGIRYKTQKGAFVTDGNLLFLSDTNHSLPILKASICEHADELARIVATRQPKVCDWCRQRLEDGTRFVRVYVQEDGRRYSFHPDCYDQRAEKHPHLPVPELLLDESGYTVLVEDSGLCCFCQIAETVYPEDTPNVCARCWKRQDEAKRQIHTGREAASA